MKFSLLNNILKLFLLVETCIASSLDISIYKVAHIGNFTIPKNSCEPILKENEAIKSPNEKYLVVLIDGGELMLIDTKHTALWESDYNRFYKHIMRSPYNLFIDNTLNSIVIRDKYNQVIWNSSLQYKSPHHGPYEVILNDEGQFYIKDITYSKPLMNPDSENIDKQTFESLCKSYDNATYGYDDFNNDICYYEGEYYEEFIDFCVNTLNSTLEYDNNKEIDICYHGKHPDKLRHNEVTFKNEEPNIYVLYYILINGKSSQKETIHQYTSELRRTKCSPLIKRKITELDSFFNPIILPGDEFYASTNETELSIGITESMEMFRYILTNYNNNQTREISFIEKYNNATGNGDVQIGILSNDGVFRIYNHLGDIIYQFGEVCSRSGSVTMKLEPTDIYLNNEYYKAGSSALAYHLVITDALGKKTYFPSNDNPWNSTIVDEIDSTTMSSPPTKTIISNSTTTIPTTTITTTTTIVPTTTTVTTTIYKFQQ